MIYILDANNIMYKIPKLRGMELEKAQNQFLHKLNGVILGKKDKLIAVFDGNQGNQTRYGKVKACFSHLGENADTVIKRLSEQYGRDEVTIVSSDREVAAYARLGGQKVLSSDEFIKHFLERNQLESEAQRLKSLEGKSKDYWLKLFQQKGG